MAATPQTNTDLAHIAAFLRERDNIVICGHVSPDGDCLGSQLALAAALRSLGKTATCVLVKDEPVDGSLAFLPGIADCVPAAQFTGVVDTFVAVDVPTRDRMGSAASALLDTCTGSVTLDHHAMDTTMTDLVYVDPDVASTTMLVWELAGLLGADRTGDVATCCYAGLVTDTGRFQFQNTNGAALRAASEMVDAGASPSFVATCVYQHRSLASIRLESRAVSRIQFEAEGAAALTYLTLQDFAEEGAIKADAEPIIDVLRSIDSVRIACVLREQEGGVRGSFRAKDDSDVAAIARKLGGGGHRAAAGFTLYCSLDEARKRVMPLIVEALCKQDARCDNTKEACHA